MRKIKKLLSAIIVMAMVCCMITLPVQAAYCCTLSIDSIVQESDKVTVNYTIKSTEDDRKITFA